MRIPNVQEVPLIDYLSKKAGLDVKIEALEVEELPDGGMGSLAIGKFYESRRFGKEVASCQFSDSDSVVVSATLNVDEAGELYELDVWKTDFKPLIRWPTTEDIE